MDEETTDKSKILEKNEIRTELSNIVEKKLLPQKIVERIEKLAKKEDITLTAPLMRKVAGGHSTLLTLLGNEFGLESLIVDGKPWEGQALAPSLEHDISVIIGRYTGKARRKKIRESVGIASALGRYGLMSTTGEPSKASSPFTVKIQSSISSNSTTHNPTGFGRLGLLEAYTPTRGAPRCLLGTTWIVPLSLLLSLR